MRYGSVCSGIEAASVAWDGLGWEAAFFAEIDPFASAVLAHRFPNVRNLGDFTKIGADDCGTIDLLVGGTPCQSFSIAGLRAGLDDPRGNLTLEFLALVGRLRPRWVLWENVPGVLSSWSDVSKSAPSERSLELLGMGGVDAAGLAAGKFVEVEQSNDFDCFLGGLAELGYGCAWRVLDAVYCGVPQRRRRVFVVGHSGGVWQRSAAVLFDSRCMSGDPPPGRKAGEEVAGTLGASTGGCDENDARDGRLVRCDRGTWWDGGDVSQTLDAVLAKGQMMPERNRFPAVLVPPGSGSAPVAFDPVNVTSKANRSNPQPGDPHHTLHQGPSLLVFSSKDSGADAGELSPTLRAMGHAGSHMNGGRQVAIAIQERAVSEGAGGPGGKGGQENIAYTMDARTKPQMVAHTPRGEGMDASEDGTGCGTPIVPVASTLTVGNLRAGGATGGNNPDLKSAAVERSEGRLAVRKLTPRECERLQGFPDGWTDIPLKRVKPGQCKSLRRDYPDRFRMIEGEEWLFAADGNRYKTIGNSMAVPVMRWIGARIAFVDALPVCPPLAEAIVRANMPPRAEREAVA